MIFRLASCLFHQFSSVNLQSPQKTQLFPNLLFASDSQSLVALFKSEKASGRELQLAMEEQSSTVLAKVLHLWEAVLPREQNLP